MSLSRFLSITSVVLATTGCSSDDCGPHGAPVDGLAVMGSGVMLGYGGLVGGPHNDCKDPSAPSGVISMTIEGMQTGGSSLIDFCVPRPDRLGQHTLTIPTDLQVIDVFGMDASCSYMLDNTMPPTGTATAAHVCGGGYDKAGFAMTFDGMATLQRTCGTTVDTIPVSLTGTVAVAIGQ